MRTLTVPNTHLHPALDYHAFCQCANEYHGNFYDFIPLDGSRLAISLGDLPSNESSSISIPCLQALVRGLTAGSHGDVEGLARELNRTLYLLGPQELCAPWFYALVDPVRHELRYVNAGHEAPLLMRASGASIERLERTGAALGLSVRELHRQRTVSVEPGDILGIFSEGVAEPAVIRAFRKHPHASATELTVRVAEQTASTSGVDRTFAAVRVVGACQRPLPEECVAVLCAA